MPVETALVVDDSKSARVMLSRMVQKTGLKVDMVESGEEAITYLSENPHPDVIFMDHMMPGMDGLETTRTLVANEATKNIPIFMYTSKEGPEYESEMLECGAYGMLGKPAKPDRLKEIIEELNARPTQETVVGEPEPADETTAAPEPEIVLEPAPEPVLEPEPEIPEVSVEQQEPAIAPEVVSMPEEEEEEMSKELIEEVASPLVARAIDDAMQPLKDAIHRLETMASENQSEIRKLNSRQASSVNMVTQPVLDASLKQTTVQLQNQLTNEIKSLRELIEQRSDLAPDVLAEIKRIAETSGGEAGQSQAEKTAQSAAEAVAAKVSAAQTEIQVKQELQPYAAQAKTANTIAIVAILVAAGALASAFLL